MEKYLIDRTKTDAHYAMLSVEEKVAYVTRRLTPPNTASGHRRWDWANQACRRAPFRLTRSAGANVYPSWLDEIAFDRKSDAM